MFEAVGGAARRLSPQFPHQFPGGAQALLSPTWSHRIQPHWPVCPFQGAPQGACHNDDCPYQMRRDYTLSVKDSLQDLFDLVSRCAILIDDFMFDMLSSLTLEGYGACARIEVESALWSISWHWLIAPVYASAAKVCCVWWRFWA